MTALNKELRETRQAKVLVEQEFQLYRDQSQASALLVTIYCVVLLWY